MRSTCTAPCAPGSPHGRPRCLPALASLALLVSLLALPARALAFDTGHHADLTYNALHDMGFGADAIKVAQVENWLTDWYSSPQTPRGFRADFEKLHCDCLFSTGQARAYWDRLSANAKSAVQRAARNDDPVMFLAILGVSLHAVQDFYTHSNWVETHPASGTAYRADTWFSAPPPAGMEVYTGWYSNELYPNKPAEARAEHGDYTHGLNHDSYIRPRWDEAYVFAYAASMEWTFAASKWANEANAGFFAKCRAYSPAGADLNALDKDLEASFRISEWIQVPGKADGHWKGSGSGSAGDFVTALKWAVAPDSLFVNAVKTKRYHLLLSAGLYGAAPASSAVPVVEPCRLNKIAVIVRTTHVAEKNDVGAFERRIDPLGKADFYARITISKGDANKQTFVEAMQLDKSEVSPSWTSIRFVDARLLQSGAPTVHVHYELWDEDGGLNGSDDHCDVNPASGKRDLDFDFDLRTHQCSGDVSGIHDSADTAVLSSGRKPDSNRAVVTLWITARPVTSP